MSQEVRDRLAGLEGWTKSAEWPAAWDKGNYTEHWHPIPDDLTTCAAMWDKYAREFGWKWAKTNNAYTAMGDGKRCVCWAESEITGTNAASELRDRWALLGEVLKARGVW